MRVQLKDFIIIIITSLYLYIWEDSRLNIEAGVAKSISSGFKRSSTFNTRSNILQYFLKLFWINLILDHTHNRQ